MGEEERPEREGDGGEGEVREGVKCGRRRNRGGREMERGQVAEGRERVGGRGQTGSRKTSRCK